MKVYFRLFAILIGSCLGSCLLAVSALGEAVPAAGSKTAVQEKGFTLTETYEGSADTDGFISDVNSSAGYVFNPHFSPFPPRGDTVPVEDDPLAKAMRFLPDAQSSV